MTIGRGGHDAGVGWVLKKKREEEVRRRQQNYVRYPEVTISKKDRMILTGQCLHCKGSGSGWIFKCNTCEGTGWVDWCQACGGDGNGFFFTCKYCEGTGKVI
jgi:DnaJ-class molecular chaperone